jgi:hypothetical protein
MKKRKTYRVDQANIDFLDSFDGRGDGYGKNGMVRRSLHLADRIHKLAGADTLAHLSRLAYEGKDDELVSQLCSALDTGEDGASEAEEPRGSENGVDRDAHSGGRSLSPVPGASSGEPVEAPSPDARDSRDTDDEDTERADPGEESEPADRHGGAVSKLFRSLAT